MRYTFGSTPAAAKRLEDVAAFFNPLSAEFISGQVKGPVESALDLGCGPGFSTDMLSHALACQQVYGLDNSASFLDMAKNRYPRYSFFMHDVTRIPFPVRPEVIYARYLLTHMQDPEALLNLWINELSEGGILLIEEVEQIDTEITAFNQYLKIIEALLDSQGADLYVGKALESADYNAETLCNEPAIVPVANHRAAKWFYLNTATLWDREDFIKENFSSDEKENVSDELKRIMESNDPAKAITWTLRRLVLRRR